ncbi:MAG: hypothetical protein JXX14_13825 [Deltaproteobacteria bacterium]|nr:hypothetical protein [Deltaproteobacteria bacterium]
MTRTSFTVGLFTLFLISGTVWANQQECDQKKNAAGDFENKIKDQGNKVKDLDNQIESVAKQPNADQKAVADLKQKKADKLKEIKEMEKQLRQMRKEEKNACNAASKCDGHKNRLGELRGEVEKIEAEVSKLKGQVKGKQAQVEALENKLKANKSNSEKLGCDRLVKDESPESTIEQCNKLFQDGMADKKEIRQHNREIGGLKGDAGRQKGNASGAINKVKQLNKQIATDCASDPVVKESDELIKKDMGVDDAIKDIEAVKAKLKEVQKIKLIKPVVGKSKPKRTPPGTKVEPKSSEPGTKVEPKSSEPGTKAEPKSSEPATKAEPKSSEPATKATPKSSEPATKATPKATQPATKAQPK